MNTSFKYLLLLPFLAVMITSCSTSYNFNHQRLYNPPAQKTKGLLQTKALYEYRINLKDGNLNLSSYREFDRQGNVVLFLQFIIEPYNTEPTVNECIRYVNTYDEQRRIIHAKGYLIKDCRKIPDQLPVPSNRDALFKIHNYQYDERGRLILQENKRFELVLKFDLNKPNFLPDSLTLSYLYAYDGSDKLVSLVAKETDYMKVPESIEINAEGNTDYITVPSHYRLYQSIKKDSLLYFHNSSKNLAYIIIKYKLDFAEGKFTNAEARELEAFLAAKPDTTAELQSLKPIVFIKRRARKTSEITTGYNLNMNENDSLTSALVDSWNVNDPYELINDSRKDYYYRYNLLGALTSVVYNRSTESEYIVQYRHKYRLKF